MALGTIVGIIYFFVIGILLSILARFISSKIFKFSHIIKYIMKILGGLYEKKDNI